MNIVKYIKKIVNRLILQIKYRGIKINSINVSRNTQFGYKNFIGEKVCIAKNCRIGDYTYFNSNYNYTIVDSNTDIGKFCSIGPGVTIGLGNHNKDFISTHPFLYEKSWDFIEENNIYETDQGQKTSIGNDVWIGANANIKRGCKIGNGAIIGMNSVVTKDVPAYAIVAGVPAKIIKYRFNDKQIEQIENIKWWEWNEDVIRKNIDKMYDIESFIKSCSNIK